jgi:hypothetical protein
LALMVHERYDVALATAEKLTEMQQDSGEVAVRSGEEWPGWPTSLAIAAWRAVMASGTHEHSDNFRSTIGDADRESHVSRLTAFGERIARAVGWLLAHRGQGVSRNENFGHNTELIGWAYAEGTHSWVEPTAFAVLALKAAGREYEASTREGVAVLIDRQLPGGGLNYGNTFVLGQLIRPHVQPTGIGLLALAGEEDSSGRIAKSVAWLRRSIGPQTTATSLGWALLGLTAQGVDLPESAEWLATAAGHVKSRDGSPYKLALLALAAKGWPR